MGSSKMAQELGTLSSDARPAFHFYPAKPVARSDRTLVPSQLPDWAGTHDDVPIIEWSSNLAAGQIHTPSAHLWRGARSVRTPGLPTLTSHSSQNVYSRHSTIPLGLAAALACKARTSTAFPSPL